MGEWGIKSDSGFFDSYIGCYDEKYIYKGIGFDKIAIAKFSEGYITSIGSYTVLATYDNKYLYGPKYSSNVLYKFESGYVNKIGVVKSIGSYDGYNGFCAAFLLWYLNFDSVEEKQVNKNQNVFKLDVRKNNDINTYNKNVKPNVVSQNYSGGLLSDMIGFIIIIAVLALFLQLLDACSAKNHNKKTSEPITQENIEISNQDIYNNLRQEDVSYFDSLYTNDNYNNLKDKKLNYVKELTQYIIECNGDYYYGSVHIVRYSVYEGGKNYGHWEDHMELINRESYFTSEKHDWRKKHLFFDDRKTNFISKYSITSDEFYNDHYIYNMIKSRCDLYTSLKTIEENKENFLLFKSDYDDFSIDSLNIVLAD